tara:strand:+ start:9728 stop:10252 length:525 start_codon:yes stop_codon:yes gene_type:complete
MTNQTLKTVTLSTSVQGLFESLIDHTIIFDGNSEKEVPLKDLVNKEMREIMAYNFITVTGGLPHLKPIYGAYTSTDSKHYTGDCLPPIYLPTNQTQLFAAGIMCALGLTMEQLTMSDRGAIKRQALSFSDASIDYLFENDFDDKHAWLSDLFYGIRAIEWGSSVDNASFYRLID